MTREFSKTWDLESLFSGGSDSLQLSDALDNLEMNLGQLEKDIISSQNYPHNIERLQNEEMVCQELESFIHCLIAQNTNDQTAIKYNERIAQAKSGLESLTTILSKQLALLPEPSFDALLEEPGISPLRFLLEERRNWEQEKLSLEQEKIINTLSVNGYNGWNSLYGTLIDNIKIPFQENGILKELSIGQAENRLYHTDRNIRKSMFDTFEQVWKKNEDSFAQVYNHLGGFRLKVYEERRWSSILKEPLYLNRMQEDTLNVMWEAVDKNNEQLVTYLQAKARLLNVPQLSWYDVEAPLGITPQHTITFEEAADSIITQLELFSPQMGQFAKETFEKKWIEAEDRSGKRPGGFCSNHPMSQQSRIFMTFSGTINNVFTLAHEIGHAYHNHVVKELPFFLQQYRMNVAETASTLAEMILVESALKCAVTPEEKISILDNKLQRSVIFFMNIRARFLFEKQFYEERKKGFIIASDLNAMMEEAQQKAYLSSLKEWHPHFWIPKQHFYFTEVPFYNFPYTFGYLFSLGLYAIAGRVGSGFAKQYDMLLKDTGRMTVEDLAKKHLDIDLTQPHFWEQALNIINNDVQQFIELLPEVEKQD